MVDDLDVTKSPQMASHVAAATAAHVQPVSPAQTYSKAFSDAVVLSAQARKVLDHLSEGKTVAEAWLDHVTAPPEPGDPIRKSAQSSAADADSEEAKASLDNAAKGTLNDIGWLIDVMNPPRVDINEVAQALAARITADNVGVLPPLPEVVARAQQAGAVAALYVENVSVTIHDGRVTEASVDRVALTTVHQSVLARVDGKDRPLVLDVGGQLQRVGEKALGRPEIDQISTTPEARPDPALRERTTASPDTGLRSDDPRHALLIVRQVTVLPEDTMRMKLDALFPID